MEVNSLNLKQMTLSDILQTNPKTVKECKQLTSELICRLNPHNKTLVAAKITEIKDFQVEFYNSINEVVSDGRENLRNVWIYSCASLELLLLIVVLYFVIS